jgi:hypothetical protein
MKTPWHKTMLWVEDKPLEKLDEVQEALQYAIQLEHATIPPYLSALYSLKAGANLPIAKLIGDIVFEEMQHMAMVANILNAIGGKPELDRVDFLPHYPGRLPFDVGDREGNPFRVSLERFSLELVDRIFMRIEEPDEPLNFPVLRRAVRGRSYRTIGDFYAALRRGLKSEWFVGKADRQVSGVVDPVYSLADAQRAIDTIVQQGEGTTTSPLSSGDQLAHYYRFAEINKGYQLVADQASFSYSGAAIPFQESEVWPLLSNPRSDAYEPGSPARVASDQFNRTYSDLLRSLQVTFDGNPGELDHAIELMVNLKELAHALVAIEIPNGAHAAPCFEYVPADT